MTDRSPVLKARNFKWMQNGSTIGVLMIMLIVLTGCEINLPWAPKKPPAKAEAAKEEAAQAEESEPATPPDESALLPGDMKTLPYEEVSIPLPDQLIIYGRLYDPSLTAQGENEIPSAEEYTGKKYPLVILLHGLNHSHLAWSDLPAQLVKAGYAVYAMDLRGHGKSSITTWKRRVTWRYFQPQQWVNLYKDVNEVIHYFKKGEDYPEVDGANVALIGEKLGANVATFSANTSPEVKSLVLISPGLSFKGIEATKGLLDYDNRTLILSNHDFADSHNQAQHLYNWITGPKTMQVYQKIGEGTDMITGQPAVQANIIEWLLQGIPTPGGAAKPTTPEADSDSSSGDSPPTAKETPKETGFNSPAAKKAVH